MPGEDLNADTRSLARFLPEGSAVDLAVFRITVALVIATSASARVAVAWARLPAEARTAPLGVDWLLPHLPITPDLVAAARVLMLVAACTSAIGLFTRTSLVVMAVSASYVLLVPQLGGAVFHDHHLLWFAALLAASPAGDALSIDAYLARRRGTPRPTRGRAHGAAIRVAWLLVAAVFFFPGVHKLHTSGLDWIVSDNLRNQFWWKWAQDPALVPSLRIDRHPVVMRSSAALAVLFELSFPVLLLRPATRALAVIAALTFHQATAYFMGIEFGVLFGCYTVFVPWEALARRFGFGGADSGALGTPIASGPDVALRRVAVVGAALVLGVVVAGATGATQAYPFACYPTFEWIAPDEMPALAVELEQRDGSVVPIDRRAWREPGPRGWALEWRLAGAYDHVDVPRIEAYFRDALSRPELSAIAASATGIRIYRVELSVDPDRHGAETSRRLVHRMALGPG